MAGWLNSLKDTALAAGVRQFLGPKLEGYGRIEQLRIDTGKRMIEMQLRLEGEDLPVEVTLRGYEIAEKGETDAATGSLGALSIGAPPGAFTTSRPWLTRLLNAHLAGRTFPIPEKYAKYARSLIG